MELLQGPLQITDALLFESLREPFIEIRRLHELLDRVRSGINISFLK